MKLFGSFTSPFVRHIRIALADIGLAYEFVETDYANSAALSPAQRVPFLHDGDLQLTDSTSILRHIRDQAGEPFLANIERLDFYCLVNTALDTTINLFLLDREGLSSDANPYLQRQAARIQTALSALEAQLNLDTLVWDDATIRLACFIDWAEYRQRLSFAQYPKLQALLAQANQHASFVATTPPTT